MRKRKNPQLQSQQNDRPLVVALYPRVSSDEQANTNNSIPIQREKLIRMLEQFQAKLATYTDGHGNEQSALFEEDASGFEYERLEMDKIRELAKRGIINAVFVTRMDRFARDNVVGPMLVRYFSKLGVRLISATEGEFTEGVMSHILMGVYFGQSADTVNAFLDRAMEARYQYAKDGVLSGQIPVLYGYKKQRLKKGVIWESHPDQAPIAKMICEWRGYERMRQTEISNRLNADNISTPTQAKGVKNLTAYPQWTPKMVSRILCNAQAYAGNYCQYKYEYSETRAIVRELPKDEQCPISIPPIISQELADLVDAVRADGKRIGQPLSKKYDYLLARRLRCAGTLDGEHTCKYTIASQTIARSKPHYSCDHYYYRCESISDRGLRTYCGFGHIHAEYLDSVVWKFIERLLTDTRATIKKYKQAQTALEEQHTEAHQRIAVIDELIAEHDTYYQNLQQKFVRDLIDEDFYKVERQRTKTMIEGFNRERVRWTEKLDAESISDQQIVDIEAEGNDLRENPGKPVTFERKLRILNKMNVTGTIEHDKGQNMVLVLKIYMHEWRCPISRVDATGHDRETRASRTGRQPDRDRGTAPRPAETRHSAQPALSFAPPSRYKMRGWLGSTLPRPPNLSYYPEQ